MRRREFITLLAGAAAWPRATRAQQPAMPVIGLLSSRANDESARLLAAFRRGLNETGYVEGQNVAIEYRWAQGKYDQLSSLAEDLVRRQVTVIVVPESSPGALAAKAATTTIPIVFHVGGDPVALGIVPSFRRPGGNITGVATLNVGVGQKRLELLHELLPTVTVIALLVNPANPVAETLTTDAHSAAGALGLKLQVLHASAERDFDTVFATLRQFRAGGLVIGPDVFFNTQIRQLATLAVRFAVPAIYQYREFVEAGGVMSYGSSLTDLACVKTHTSATCTIPAAWPLRRSDPQGGKAGRLAGPAGHKGGVDPQPQGRQRARHHSAAAAARPCRRGDRMRFAR
jgi:putative tryptophan/tyrosine transport system substrate-binding protein